MSPVTTIFYCVMNSVFLFFFCLKKLTKVNFPNEHVQLSDLIIIHQLYIWYEGELSACGVSTHVSSSLVTENHQRTDVYFPAHAW